MRARLDDFAVRHGIERDVLTGAIRACRFLFRAAARQVLTIDQLVDDLEALGVGTPAAKMLVSGYPRATQILRREYIHATLRDHGKLLHDVSWRVDTVRTSDRGVGFEAPITSLTLSYREGDEERRVTLQALPELLLELQDAITTIIDTERARAGVPAPSRSKEGRRGRDSNPR